MNDEDKKEQVQQTGLETDAEVTRVEKIVEEEAPEEKPSPTRYGDWEKKGRCIDF